MPTENLDAEPLTPASNAPATRGFRLPADYYSAPLSEVRPLFPKWVPYGCGAAAAVFLLLLFASSALFTGARLGAGIDFVIGMSLGEVRGMFTSEVSSEQKDAFEREVKAMRDGVRTNRVQVANVQPFLQAMQKAIGDKTVTPQEVENLTRVAREASTKK
jgi:hypothetical protein